MECWWLVSRPSRTLGRLYGRLYACETEKPLQTLTPDAWTLGHFQFRDAGGGEIFLLSTVASFPISAFCFLLSDLPSVLCPLPSVPWSLGLPVIYTYLHLSTAIYTKKRLRAFY